MRGPVGNRHAESYPGSQRSKLLQALEFLERVRGQRHPALERVPGVYVYPDVLERLALETVPVGAVAEVRDRRAREIERAAVVSHDDLHDRGLVAEWESPDGARESREAASVIIGNCPLYAGIVRLRRDASLQDSLLDLALLPSTGFMPLLSAAITAILSDLASSRGVLVEPARSVRVRADRPAAVHVDAEPMGTTPIEVEVLAGALSFRTP